MYLKRLDVIGFKSFATRTTFAFEPGITVLCGPNGSGKSNVADAVRWVLGEQSARAIRGRRGEDVIFVGSQGRQPLGLSEVSITLDNADGRLPLEYEEVKVTRRLYRSGEAEYLVNGSRVRLKDIHSWLFHAALDPDAYVVIGQGSVDELILQRAEERRVVLENAADIRRHQARLAEARSKVAATEENLLRCRAVIAELEPHVKRLGGQAERAERYAACREELVGLAGRWFRHAIRVATAELEQARGAVTRARAVSDELEQTLAEVEAEVRRADAAAAEADAALAEQEPVLTALLAEQGRIAGEQAIAAERGRAARETQERLRGEATALADRAGALRADLDRLRDQAAAERTTLEEDERALQTASGDQDARERALRAAEAELDRFRREAAGQAADARALRAGLEEAGERIGRAERRRAEAADAVARLEAELAAATRRADELAAGAEARREEAAKLRQGRAELLTMRDEARRTGDAARAEQHRLAGERQRFQIARRALEDASAQAGSGAGLILDAGLPGARGQLGGELRVPNEIQTAVSAALGESVHAVLVEDPDGARIGLELIGNRGAARTGLVLLNGAAEAPPTEVTLEFKELARPLLEGLPLHGFADELVTCEPELETVRTRYLALVVVAPDLAVAREAARRLAAHAGSIAPWQVATTDGQVIRWTGEWRGGRDRAAERLVARRQELAGLEAELARVEAALVEIDARLAEAAEREAALAADEVALRGRLAEAELAERQAVLDAQSAAGRLAGLRRETEQARTDEPRAVADLDRARGQLASLQGQLATAEQAGADLAAAVERAEATAAAARIAYEELRTAEAERRAALAARRTAFASHEELLARLTGELAGVERAIAAAESRLDAEVAREQGESERLAELTAARADVEARAAAMSEEVAALRARRRSAAGERADLERRAAELRATIRGQRTVLEAALLAEGRAGDRLERVRREAQEYVEELGVEGRGSGVGEDAGELAVWEQLGFGTLDDHQPPSPDPRHPSPDPEAVRRRMNALRRELRAIGPVNEATLAEFRELHDRHGFLTTQTSDLETTLGELRSAMAELEGSMRGAFDDAFARVNAAFGEYFERLFGGGHAELVLTRPEDVLETGVDIVARPPGKRLQPLVSLSGGERALTMVALIFGLLKTNPAPFCVLDEVDAALDESNVRRFTDMLRELSERTQFIVVTHNRATMEIAQALYGISMDAQGVSTVVSLRLPETVGA